MECFNEELVATANRQAAVSPEWCGYLDEYDVAVGETLAGG